MQRRAGVGPFRKGKIGPVSWRGLAALSPHGANLLILVLGRHAARAVRSGRGARTFGADPGSAAGTFNRSRSACTAPEREIKPHQASTGWRQFAFCRTEGARPPQCHGRHSGIPVDHPNRGPSCRRHRRWHDGRRRSLSVAESFKRRTVPPEDLGGGCVCAQQETHQRVIRRSCLTDCIARQDVLPERLVEVCGSRNHRCRGKFLRSG